MSCGIFEIREIRAQVLPEPVNYLGAGFDLYNFASWQFMFVHFCLVWLHPGIFAILQNLLLLVDDVVVRDATNVHLVCACTIRMQDDLSALQELVGDRLPISPTDGSWSWYSFVCVLGFQPE